jgi:mono/diheme cytochrome c family protein
MQIGIGIPLGVILAVAGLPLAFAQSGADIYKAKCQSCHGTTGLADTAVGKTLKVKPITDPSVVRYSEAAMIEATRNGLGKMQAYKGKLTDAEIKDSVARFRSFMK